MTLDDSGRQAARFGVRAAVLSLIDMVPWLGSLVTRILEDRFPSPREKEQAALIAAQQERIARLEGQSQRATSLQGARDRRKQDATLDALIGPRRRQY
jgi:hypothetical protein